MEDAFNIESATSIQTYDYYKYKITYTGASEKLMFLFVTGLTDRADSIQKELIKCKEEFLNLFGDIVQHKLDAKTFSVFDTTVDSIHRNLRPKISLVGFSGVGKTTITKLIKAEEIPMKHVPTITGDIATIKIGKLHFHLWDFAGQEQFSYLWNNFVKGSDAVLLVTDSTLENVEKSKFFLELIKEEAPDAHTAVIGNKQDLGDALKPSQIEKILGLKTYSMIATDPGNRDKMIQIIADILEMSAEISPLLRPLLQRDKFTEDAMKALESREFNKALILFQKISDLCIELGDDSLGREFYEKAEKIKEILSSAEITEIAEELTQEPQVSEIPEEQKISKALEVSPPPPQAPEILEEPKIPKAPEPLTPQAPEILEEPKIPKASEPLPPQELEIPKEPKLPEVPQKIEPIKPSEQIIIEKPPFLKALETEEEEMLVKSAIPKTNTGIELKPEDFIIRQSPKKILEVPEDAKTKLKTSSFGHVLNPDKKAPQITPVAPKKITSSISKPPKLITPIIPKKPVKLKPPIIPKKPIKPSPPVSEVSEPTVQESSLEPSIDLPEGASKKQIEKSLMDLKIKKAKLQEMALDFDMQELSGEITVEELSEKKMKLMIIEEKTAKQIQEIQKILDNLE
ncbi:MAG: ADP-ribosylation factor-like protein [Candidatus Thorarchaeota archaeon]